MHLAGRLNLVKEEYRELIREGAEYYKKLAGVKDSAIPVMPNGFTGYGEETVCLGFIAKGKLYLALYNLKNEKRTVTQDLSKYGVKSIELAYPRGAKNKFSLVQGSIVCEMEPNSARAFELIL